VTGPEEQRCREAFNHSLSELVRAFHKLGLSRETLVLSLCGSAFALLKHPGPHHGDKDREDAF